MAQQHAAAHAARPSVPLLAALLLSFRPPSACCDSRSGLQQAHTTTHNKAIHRQLGAAKQGTAQHRLRHRQKHHGTAPQEGTSSTESGREGGRES